MDDRSARDRMVDVQIAGRGVREPRVLEAMRAVPRHLFVAEDVRGEAYDDRPLAIGEGQTISQPYMVGAMTAALAPADTHRVLEIGTGSGYQTAILAQLAAEVISIERLPALAARAQQILSALAVTNVRIVVADGTEGYAPAAPYDRILVTAGAPSIPAPLKAQLAEGGRLVIPVGPGGYQRLLIVDRVQGGFTERQGEGCVFVPLIGRSGWPSS